MLKKKGTHVLLRATNFMQHFFSIILVSVSSFFGSLHPNFHIQQIRLLPVMYENIHADIKNLEKNIINIAHRLDNINRSQPKNTTSLPLEPEPVETPPQNAITNRKEITAENIIYFTNQERITRNLNSLKYNSRLSKSAQAKGTDMIRYNYFAHESPEPSHHDFSYFIDQQNYQFIRISENLAMGEFATAQEVVTAWMNSPGHRANILYANYRDIGVSVSQKKSKNTGYDIIIVQHFGTPKTNCADIPQELTKQLTSISNDANQAKEKAEILKTKIDAQTSSLDDQNLYELIEIYNTTIRSYNALAQKFETITNIYNTEAKKYNACITK